MQHVLYEWKLQHLLAHAAASDLERGRDLRPSLNEQNLFLL
jgi:hypothetical protein